MSIKTRSDYAVKHLGFPEASEVCDLIKFIVYEPPLLKDFRRACHQEETTPLQMLYDFLRVYAYTDYWKKKK